MGNVRYGRPATDKHRGEYNDRRFLHNEKLVPVEQTNGANSEVVSDHWPCPSAAPRIGLSSSRGVQSLLGGRLITRQLAMQSGCQQPAPVRPSMAAIVWQSARRSDAQLA